MVNTSVLRSLYPFQSHYLALERQRMHYVDEGQGEVLLALHGNPTWSFYYRHLIVSLRKHYRVVVPDHIGCGFSDKPDDSQYSYHLEQRVRDIEALVRKLQLRDLTLVLHDWGGMIGLAFAIRNPGLVRRIVLMNTAGFPLPKSKSFPLALAVGRSSWLGALLVRGLNAFALGAALIGTKRHKLPPTLRRAYLAPYDSWDHRRAVHRFVQDIPLKPSDASWPLVESVSRQLELLSKKPVQIIWGERDFVFDRHFLAEWRRRLPLAEIHSYQDVGHYVLEDLGDDAVTLIEDFLKRHPLAP